MRREFGRWRGDDRAVSSAVSYVLTLGITAMMVSGLLVGGGQYVANERQQVTAQQLDVLVEQLAAGVTDSDRLSQADAAPDDVRVEVELPTRAAGSPYAVAVEDAPNGSDQPHRHVLRFSTAEPDVTASVTVETHRDVVSEVSSPGSVVIEYRDADGDAEAELVVVSASDATASLRAPVAEVSP